MTAPLLCRPGRCRWKTRPRLGEFGRQLFEHLGDLVIDVLRAVVGMEAKKTKRESSQQRRDDRQQIGFADLLADGNQLPLGDAIDGVDVIDTLETVLIALMDAVDADEARASIRGWAPRSPMAMPVGRVLVNTRRRSMYPCRLRRL